MSSKSLRGIDDNVRKRDGRCVGRCIANKEILEWKEVAGADRGILKAMVVFNQMYEFHDE